MSGYASGTKATELALTDEPDLQREVPAREGGPSSPNAAPAADAHRATHSAVVKAELLRIAEAPPEVVEIGTVEAGLRAQVADAARERAADDPADYLAEAAREFGAGTIDKPLWAKAMELSGNDGVLAKQGYLRARAAALRVAKRSTRAESRARRARELSEEEKNWPAAPPRVRPRSRRRRTMIVAGVFGSALVVAGFVALRSTDNPPPPAAPVQAARVANPAPTASTAAAAVANSTAKHGGPERRAVSNEDFAAKVEELKTAGNWNVLVLYAVEWTRKSPESADAWNELGAGYVKLRQFNEALEAATNAARLAPARLETWQRLGEINVALRQPGEAIAAYEKAVALNERDVTSLVQMGTLHAQLGQLSQAKNTFARALDVSPTDAEALCGSAAIAQKEGRPKDADSIARQIKAADLRCAEAVAVAPASVAPPPSARRKPAERTAR